MPQEAGSVEVVVRASLDKLTRDLDASRQKTAAYARGVNANFESISNATAKVIEQQRRLASVFDKPKLSWQEFLRQNLAGYQQLEGSHSAAMRRMSAEWGAYKAAAAGGYAELQKFRVAAQGISGPSAGQLLGQAPAASFASRAADMAAYGQQLDGLRAKYVPLSVAQQQYRQSLTEIKTAAASGIISERERAQALTATKRAFAEQVRGIAAARVASSDLGAALSNVRRRVDATSQSVGVSTGMLRQFRVMLASIGLTLGVGQLISITNAWSDYNARLKIATGSTEQGRAVMERLSDMARRTYSSLETTAESFLLNSTALKQLGYSTKTQLDFTEALNNALVVSGAKGERAASIMFSMSRAMAGGALRGQELNTIMQSGDRVASALAAGLGVTTLELRRMGMEGKLGTGKVIEALVSQLEKLRAEADSMPATIGDAFILLRNSLLRYIGVLDEANGLSVNFAKGVIAIGDNMNIVAGVLAGAGVAAALAFSGAIAAATASVWGLTAALLANPIGLVVAGIAIAVGALVAFRDETLKLGSVTVNVGEILKAVWATVTESIKGPLFWLMKLAEAAGRFMTLDFSGAQRAFLDAGKEAVKSGKAILAAWDKVFDGINRRQQEIDASMDTSGISDRDVKKPGLPDPRALKKFSESLQGARDKILGLQIGLRTLDMPIGQATEYRTRLELMNEATKNNIEITPTMQRNIDNLARSMGFFAEKTANATKEQELLLERAQIGMTDVDARISRELNAANIDADSARGRALADMIRTNEQLRTAKQLTTEFATGFAQSFTSSLREGAKTWEAFSKAGLGALNRLTDKLLDMAVTNLVARAFGGLTGGAGLGGGATAGRGGLLGGFLIPGILHGGGVAGDAPSSGRLLPSSIFVSAPRFHSGKPAFGPNEMPAILDRREEVGYPAQLARKYGGGGTEIRVYATIDLEGANGEEAIAAAAGRGAQAALQQATAQLNQFDRNLPMRLKEIQVRGA